MVATPRIAVGDMAQVVPLTLNERNDENVTVSITTNDPTASTPLNITGMAIEVFLKPSKASADDDAAVWKGTTTGGEVTVVDAPNGGISIAIPAASIDLSKTWWKVDVLSGTGKRKTAIGGAVTVTDW